MFGTKKINENYSDYNGYTDYNNEYGNFEQGNYNNYNNYQQGYQQNYQNNDYQNNNYQSNDYQNDSYLNNNYQNNNYQNNNYQENAYNKEEYQEDYEDFNVSFQDDDYQSDYQNTGYIDENVSKMQNIGNTSQAFDMTQSFNSQSDYSAQPNYSDMQSDYSTENNYQNAEEYYEESLYNINPIQPGNSRALLGKVVLMAGICVVGVVCGALTDSALSNFWMQNIESDSIIIEAGKVMAIILYTYVVSIIHTLLHELGHQIGGQVTEYSKVSFRIFNMTFVNTDTGTKMKKYSVPGTAGECIMMPPEIKNGRYPFMLYKLGGILMNLITSLAAIVLMIKVAPIGRYPFNMMCVIFAVIGLVTIVYNGLPLIINGIPNDGYTLAHMVRSQDARIAVHSYLLINAYLSKGGRYSDIPFEQFYLDAGGNYSGHLWVKVKLLEYRWHLEHMDFAKAAECLNIMDYNFKKLPRIFQYEINSEKLFLEMIGSNNSEIVEKLYNIDIKHYLEDTQGQMTSSRIMMAYEACVAGNLKLANKYYNALKNGVKSEPLKGEVDLELMMGMYIYERFCTNTN